jgi:hypothetical protein
MATMTPQDLDARVSAVDLTGKEYFLAIIDSSGEYDLAGLGENAVGTIQEGKALGLSSTVALDGVVKCVAGTAIVAGEKIASDAVGKAKVVATTEHIVGVAMTAASADLVVFELRLEQHGILV